MVTVDEPHELLERLHRETVGELWDGVVASGDVRDVVRRRFHTTVDTAGLDETRARDWAVLLLVLAAVDELGRRGPDPAAVTRSTTIAKAVQE